jgi:hypothetical protein
MGPPELIPRGIARKFDYRLEFKQFKTAFTDHLQYSD